MSVDSRLSPLFFSLQLRLQIFGHIAATEKLLIFEIVLKWYLNSFNISAITPCTTTRCTYEPSYFNEILNGFKLTKLNCGVNHTEELLHNQVRSLVM